MGHEKAMGVLFIDAVVCICICDCVADEGGLCEEE